MTPPMACSRMEPVPSPHQQKLRDVLHLGAGLHGNVRRIDRADRVEAAYVDERAVRVARGGPRVAAACDAYWTTRL